MRKSFDHRKLYGQMDDGGQSCQKMSEADGQQLLTGSGVNCKVR